jgi:hypothetical protein
MKINPQLIAWLASNVDSDGDVIRVDESDDVYFATLLMECRASNLISLERVKNGVICYTLTPQGEYHIDLWTNSIPAAREPQADSGALKSRSGVTVEDVLEHGLFIETRNGYEVHKYLGWYYAFYDGVPEYSSFVLEAIRRYIEKQQLPDAPLQADSSTPVSDSGAGDKWNNEYYLDKDGDYFRLYKTSQVAPIADFSYGEKAVAEITTRLLNKEIASLRSQLAEITRDAQRYLAQVAERERQLAAATRELESMKAEIGHLGKTIDEAGYYLGQASDRDENSNRAYSILKGYSVAD